MTKSEQKQKYAAPWQIVLMVIGFVVMTPIYMITIYVLLSLFVISPIANHFDRIKFEKVDTFSRSIYNKLSDASHGAEKWKYAKECTPEHDAWFLTGNYLCKTMSTTQVEITHLADLNRLNEKYFKIIDDSLSLKMRDFAVFYPSIFGKKFQVSSTVKTYDHKTENSVVCTYTIKLDQPDRDDISNSYGDDIIGKTGQVNISFNCSNLARSDWYK